MDISQETAPVQAKASEGWNQPGWKLFRWLFQLVLRLPDRLLLGLSRSVTIQAGIAPLDPRARFHAWFIMRFRRAIAPEPEAQRRPALLSLALLEAPPSKTVTVTEFDVPGPAGPLAARLYRPQSARSASLPLVVYFHFGGCVLGDLDTCHTACSLLAERADCLILSVSYRLAPEHRFPAALDDALAAFHWAVANAGRIGADAGRVAIGGDSAGGYLAAAASLVLRDTGAALPFLQLLIYPVLEMDRRSLPATPFDDSYPLSRDDMIWFADLYMRAPVDAEDPRCSVARAAHLAGLPPTLLVQAGHDLLREEGSAFARRLESEDVPLRCLDFPTLPHAFTAMSGGLPAARKALLDIGEALSEAFCGDRNLFSKQGVTNP
jgi:acetyl esterase/lipase